MRHELRQPNLSEQTGPKGLHGFMVTEWLGFHERTEAVPCSGPSEAHRRFARPGTLLATKLFSLKLTGTPQPVSLGQPSVVPALR